MSVFQESRSGWLPICADAHTTLGGRVEKYYNGKGGAFASDRAHRRSNAARPGACDSRAARKLD